MTLDPTQPIPSAATPSVPAAEPVPTRVTVRKRSSSVLNFLLIGAAAVAIGGVAFAAGRTTAPSAATFPGRFTDGTIPGDGQGGGRGVFGGAGGPTLSGTVTAIDGDSMTLTTASGQTIEIALDQETEYHTQADATAGDVTTGTQVEVQVDMAGRDPGQGGQGAQGSGDTGSLGTAGDVTIVPSTSE